MNAKTYLQQLKEMNNEINMKLEKIYELRTESCSIGVSGNGDKIICSKNPDKMGDLVTKIVAMENEVDELIDSYVDLKDEIITQISKLDKKTYKYVLYKRDVKFETFDKIAKEMGMTRGGAYKVHKKAVKDFHRILFTQNVV